MNKNPLSWTASDVGLWLSSINCSGARDIFKFHGIDGKDLLQLSDLDLRVDLKFKRVHDRKYLLRKITELRLGLFAVIEVFYANDVCRIRVADLESYTFEKLRKDAARYWGVESEACVVQDQEGFVLGSFPVASFFDSSNRQQEPVFLIPAMPGEEPHLQRLPEPLHSEADEEVNEDRALEEAHPPYLEAEKQLLGQKKRPVKRAKKPETEGKPHASSPQDSARSKKPGPRSDDEDDLQTVLTLMK
jgi:hypothetical protein